MPSIKIRPVRTLLDWYDMTMTPKQKAEFEKKNPNIKFPSKRRKRFDLDFKIDLYGN